ncbi:sugar phosphate isomerase/epimerase family protein [Euzebyella saccharophila]|uniref:Sugar phosphate isomerase/epimerase family protein n=1 Tax=Euzebyella saccharophila TaxID=679664 RepID=A0ABV8JQ27_9FLAO|nr:sugar phosphate isomerase/epimerase family protein [Euzebyella saccharophila]
MSTNINRRKALGSIALGATAAISNLSFTHLAFDKISLLEEKLPFRISMNCSTLLHYKLPADTQIDLIANAGFDGIEMWMSDIKTFLEKGGSTATLRSKLKEYNLVLENIIGFSKWCSDNAEERSKALAQLKDEMEITKELGGKFIATPVQGIEKIDPNKYDQYAERYAAILELGDETGVTPILELWGMGALHKISDCTQIAIATGHPKATMLLDFYHVHRGGNDWDTLDLINAGKLPVIHMNDYPATPAFNLLTDADRVLPGDGVCDFETIIPKLYQAGFRGGFSVELFNKTYWNTMDAPTLMKTCYEKTREVVTKALNGK